MVPGRGRISLPVPFSHLLVLLQAQDQGGLESSPSPVGQFPPHHPCPAFSRSLGVPTTGACTNCPDCWVPPLALATLYIPGPPTTWGPLEPTWPYQCSGLQWSPVHLTQFEGLAKGPLTHLTP